MFKLPTLVWALAGGVILRNVLESIFKVNIFDRAINIFGNASISVYLSDGVVVNSNYGNWPNLAGPLMVILGAQTLTMALYAAFVTFRIMGKNYDAAVLAAGHCGFGIRGQRQQQSQICRPLPICMVHLIKRS